MSPFEIAIGSSSVNLGLVPSSPVSSTTGLCALSLKSPSSLVGPEHRDPRRGHRAEVLLLVELAEELALRALGLGEVHLPGHEVARLLGVVSPLPPPALTWKPVTLPTAWHGSLGQLGFGVSLVLPIATASSPWAPAAAASASAATSPASAPSSARPRWRRLGEVASGLGIGHGRQQTPSAGCRVAGGEKRRIS